MGGRRSRLWIAAVLVLSIYLGIGISTNSIITVMQENIPLSDRKTVILDAGHGGEDGGASSQDGKLESMINLELAKRLNDLMHLIGIQTVMIRDTDRSVYTSGNSLSEKKISDLKNRVEMINTLDQQILISIHQNYYTDSRYSGAQVFYAPTDGSRELAERLQSALIASVNPGSTRQIKRADGIYLMQHIDCPGVLIECGFLSNLAEAEMLSEPEYQKKLCCVIASSCSRYLFQEQSVT